LKRKPLFSQPVTISAVETKNDKGRFFEVVLRPNGGEGAFDWRPYADLYRAYKSTLIRADGDREGFAAEAATADPDGDLPDGLADALDGSKPLF
jgi:hypothetical protein